MKIGASGGARVEWQASVDASHATTHCDAGGTPGPSLDVALERGEGSLAGAEFGQNLWASAGEKAKAGGAGPGDALGHENDVAAALALLGSAGEGAPSALAAAYLAERGAYAADVLAAALGSVAEGAGGPGGAGARPDAMAHPARPDAVSGAREGLAEGGASGAREAPEASRAYGSFGRAHDDGAPRHPQRQAPAEREPRPTTGFLVDAEVFGRWGGLRATPRRFEEVERPRPDGPRRAYAVETDALVVHDVRRCPVRRLRFELDASYRDARSRCAVEFDDATYERVTLDEAGAAFFGRAAQGGHARATARVLALLRAFATGESLTFPIAFEPTPTPGEPAAGEPATG